MGCSPTSPLLGLLALALIALSYTAANAIGAWGFLAVFAAGIGLRHAEVSTVEEDLVVVALAGGPASLPRTQLAMPADKITFLATAAALEAAVAAQGGD